jgi:hypothetical protein
MVGVLLQEAVLEAALGPNLLHNTQTAIGCDYSPSVAWTLRMATRSTSPISFCLLRGLAMQQRITKSAPPAIFDVAGIQNVLAVKGGASHFHQSPRAMCPAEFLTHYNSFYPLPQKQRWTNVQLHSDLWSSVILTLCGQQLPLQARSTAWIHWTHYACKCRIDPWMQYHSKQSQQTYCIAFAARVRTGIFGNASQVGHQSVEKVLRHVAQTLLLAGYDDPRRTYRSKELDLPFRHLFKSYKNQDPAPQPQLAIPVLTIKRAAAYHPRPTRLSPAPLLI